MGIFLYFAVMIILTGSFLALNWKYKWIDKYWIERNDFEFALGSLMFILWPIGIIILVVMLIFAGIRHFFIPD